MSGLTTVPGLSVGGGLAGGGGLSSGHGLTPGATRRFTISPAVSGKTLWDLDVDGPCTLARSGSPYTFTALAGFSAQFELWGPGGSTGGIGATTATAGANPTQATSVNIQQLVGGAGTSSAAATTNGAGNGRAGGTATGGDTNTVGTAGTNGTIAATCIAGNGGASANGGGTATGLSAAAGVTVAGVAGNFPGGGAAGAAHGDAVAGSRRATGGGGGGGYVKKTYALGQFTLVPRNIVVGAGGVAGTGDLAAGAAGADGKVLIT